MPCLPLRLLTIAYTRMTPHLPSPTSTNTMTNTHAHTQARTHAHTHTHTHTHTSYVCYYWAVGQGGRGEDGKTEVIVIAKVTGAAKRSVSCPNNTTGFGISIDTTSKDQ